MHTTTGSGFGAVAAVVAGRPILQFANPMSYYIFMTELIDLSQVTDERTDGSAPDGRISKY